MKGVYILIINLACIFVSLISKESNAARHEEDNGVYIIYMGAAPISVNGAPRNDHLQLLTSLSKKNVVVQTYSKGFSGIAARLSKEEAISISQRTGVVSVFPEQISKLQTTRSWDFLNSQTINEIDSHPSLGPKSLSNEEDVIVGVLDSGITPEAKSFNDEGYGPIPARWNGICMRGQNFNTSNCNRKLIGARFYEDMDNPRDVIGHGTHVTSTIAGNLVSGASYHGIDMGTAKGGSPRSRLAMYRVCKYRYCTDSAILKAFDDAIGDKVDVLSLSLGSPPKGLLSDNAVAIGSFHATEKGIPVVCAAGNDGPYPSTVTNVAPWITTVAATSIDRFFQTDVLLGNNNTIKGGGLHFGKIQKYAVYPLIYGVSSDTHTRNCDTMDPKQAKGKIVLCEEGFNSYSFIEQMGAVGLIMTDDNPIVETTISDSFPVAVVNSKDADKILSYIDSNTKPVATLLPTLTVINYKPAPAVAAFSSRGPSQITKNIIKPDIGAPGADIFAAMPPNLDRVLAGKEQSIFGFLSGTSMSTPHVSGVVAVLKSHYPLWSPSAIRSAIMTTANPRNNLKAPITTHSGSIATPFDIGSGELNPTSSLNPGLVYETEIVDYLQFLCNIGYNISTIKLIASKIPNGFSCPKSASEDLVSNLNYPSIAISNLQASKSKKVKRTVTNVGEGNSIYTVKVETPTGLQVDITPSTLKFTKKNQSLSYEVIFTASIPPKEDMFGSITWTNDKYTVRSPFVVNRN